MLYKIFIIISIIYLIPCQTRELPSFVKTCSRSDPNLSQCWKESMISLIPRLKDGIPEMGIKSVEPIFLPTVDLDVGGNNNLAFTAKLTDVNFYGCSEFTLHDVKVVLTNNTDDVNLHIVFPVIYLKSDYKAAANVDIKWEMHCKNVLKKGKVHSNIDEVILDIKIEKIHMNFNKLLGDNQELNDNVNSVINENIDLFYEEVRPIIEHIIGEIFKDTASKVFSLFPRDVLYPE